MKTSVLRRLTGAVLALAILAGCTANGDADEPRLVSGKIRIDGSSTLYPLTSAAAEDFVAQGHSVRFTIGAAGSGPGFDAFCAGRLDIVDASRPIDRAERAACRDNQTTYTRFRVSTDALTVIAHPRLGFTDCLTTRQLARIWGPAADGVVTDWSQVDPRFPQAELRLFAPGPESGTFDYFTEAIVGTEGSTRRDYDLRTDDNEVVAAVAHTPRAIGYVGYSYYDTHRAQLKALEVDAGRGCVEPSTETAADGSYRPLSRPLYVYVSDRAFARKEAVGAFLAFYLDNLDRLAESTGFVPLSPAQATRADTALDAIN